VNIIGICGHAGSGKDTAADFLVKEGYCKVSLADPLKRICADVFGFTKEQLWGPSENRNAGDPRYPRTRAVHPGLDHLEPDLLSPRVALQTLGTEFGRYCYDNVWIDYAIRVARRVLEDQGQSPFEAHQGCWFYSPARGLWGDPRAPRSDRAQGVVIPDVRFRNEVDAIKQAGGRVFRIARPGSTGDVGIKGHASESEMDGISVERFDALIENTGTLEGLKKVVLAVAHLHTGAIMDAVLKENVR
jgi:hypothetical protein